MEDAVLPPGDAPVFTASLETDAKEVGKKVNC